MINNYKIDFHTSLIIGFVMCTLRWSTTSLHVPGLLVGWPQGGLNLLPEKKVFWVRELFCCWRWIHFVTCGPPGKEGSHLFESRNWKEQNINIETIVRILLLILGPSKNKKNDLCIIRSASLNDFSGDRHLYVWQLMYSNFIAKSENTFP